MVSMIKKKSTDSPFRPFVYVASGMLVIVFLAWGIYLLVVTQSFSSWTDRGQFGDTFGGFNALVSGAAFIAATIAILLQGDALRQQSDDLDSFMKEIRVQNLILSQQTFEGTFFKLLGLYTEIVTSMKLVLPPSPDRANSKTLLGRDCFDHFLGELRSHSLPKLHPDPPEQVIEDIREAFDKLFADYDRYLGHYFRHLCNMFQFLETSGLDDKKLYARIVRAQLSDHELVLLFYDGLSRQGAPFKPLIEEFGLLGTERFEQWLIDIKHKEFYEQRAYLK